MDRPKHPLRAGIVHSIRPGLPNKKASQSVRKKRQVFDKPFVKKSALIGTEDLLASFCDELKSFSRRELLIFKAREEALDWLAADLVDA